jgi:drug/metabolite transporter (DMT)-like permease
MPPSANPDKNLAIAIALKLTSVLLFAAMSTFIRITGQTFPLGQVIFFRSAFAILPVVLIYTWRNELRAAVVTQRPFGHLLRGSQGIAGMFLNFAALARLPLMDATAISFASPLITVALAAVVLKERVHAYRWSAVAFGPNFLSALTTIIAGSQQLLLPQSGFAPCAASAL